MIWSFFLSIPLCTKWIGLSSPSTHRCLVYVLEGRVLLHTHVCSKDHISEDVATSHIASTHGRLQPALVPAGETIQSHGHGCNCLLILFILFLHNLSLDHKRIWSTWICLIIFICFVITFIRLSIVLIFCISMVYCPSLLLE